MGMAYAIVINLDYEAHAAEICRDLWSEIRQKMLEAGFRLDGRTFVINLPEVQACELARQVIDSIEGHLEYHRKHMHKYIRDFYGFPADERVNLLVSGAGDIQVDDVDVVAEDLD
jgi:hypothetical protein